MPATRVPLPCVVYTRLVSGGVYTFSHHCGQTVPKQFPPSLRTADLSQHDAGQNWANLRRACFLVLVAGDVAQCISLANVHDKSRIRFLYNGSAYARKAAPEWPSEVHEDFVSLHFHGTMAVFDKSNRYHSAIPLESGISLFPRQIREKDIPLLARWTEACMLRSTQTSVWVTDTGESYNEHTLRWSPRVKQRDV